MTCEADEVIREALIVDNHKEYQDLLLEKVTRFKELCQDQPKPEKEKGKGITAH